MKEDPKITCLESNKPTQNDESIILNRSRPNRNQGN